jgi:two-component system LytT family response regulator
MEKVKLLLVEDDIFYQKIVERVIKGNFPEVVITGIAKDVKSAKESIKNDNPHILVLDVNLPDGTSFDLLQQIDKRNHRIVFISAHSEYLVEALRFSFVDFIFKPFDAIDLIVAIDDAISELEESFYYVKLEVLVENINSEKGVSKMVIQGKRSVKAVDISDIVWAGSVYSGSLFYFTDGTVFLSPLPLRRYELLLRSHGFMRCHPKTLINLKHVRFMDEKKNRLYFGDGLHVNYDPHKTNHLKKFVKQRMISKARRLQA